jgi:predicted metal-dependent peptidase
MTHDADKDLRLKLDRARWWVLRNQAFYGQMAMRLRDEIVDDAVAPTAQTDGERIQWGRTFLGTLDDEETRFVVLHETDHCAHFHPWRLPADQEGNEAGDYAINGILATIPGIKMPAGGLLDAQYDGLAEEEILGKLRARPKRKPGNPGPCGIFTVPGAGTADPNGKPNPAKRDALKASWERAVIQAAQMANRKGLGDLPADLARQLERLRATPIDWKQAMADFVKTAASQRNDWSRSARRHAWQPVIYPRKRRDQVGTIVFARDTSGSVDDKTDALYTACIDAAMAETNCSAIVLDCDTAIHDPEIRLEPGDPCPLKAHGGGGTDFRPVFARAQELNAEGEAIAGVVYLTDFDGPTGDDVGIPTLWIVTPGGGHRTQQNLLHAWGAKVAVPA